MTADKLEKDKERVSIYRQRSREAAFLPRHVSCAQIPGMTGWPLCEFTPSDFLARGVSWRLPRVTWKVAGVSEMGLGATRDRGLYPVR